MSDLYDPKGRPIQLGTKLGGGGEGAVYELRNHPRLAAKIYHTQISRAKHSKLSVMVREQTERLKKLTAWPLSTLRDSSSPGGRIRGIVIPKILGHRDIHELYTPSSRKREFPKAGWRFLIHTASNAARAVAVVHKHGHVIGDINHGNFLVAKDATVKLIDCDSIQISSDYRNTTYLCEVGVPEYTPPELQGRTLSNVKRTRSHDSFGLAVLIFHLLMMGRHPFAGTPLDREYLPIAKAIREGRFAYGPEARSRGIQQPPSTLPLQAVSKPVANLFKLAFTGPERPSPTSWMRALDTLSRKLRSCANNKLHQYYQGMPNCPWCAIEGNSNIVLYLSGLVLPGQRGRSFDIKAAWSSISAVKAPRPAPGVPRPNTQNIKPSGTARKIRYSILLRKAGGIGLALCTTAFAGVLIPDVGIFAVIIWFIGIGLASNLWNSTPSEAQSLKAKHRTAKREYSNLKHKWDASASREAFDIKKDELKKARDGLLNLNSWRQKLIAQLSSKREQMKRYRESFRVINCDVRGIGPERKQMLMSYGVETAEDVTGSAVRAVPGFGPTYTTRMVKWRNAVERGFVYDPNFKRNPKIQKEADRRVEQRRIRLSKALQDGPAELRKIRLATESARRELTPEIRTAARNLSHAEVNLKYVMGM